MRCGPPASFGWLKIEKRNDDDLWELPTGYQVALDRGMWLELDDNGTITVIEPRPKAH
jgi:hypothetical protein